MAEKFGTSTKLGGKGSQRKGKLVVHRSHAEVDKKISSLIKKTQAKKINDIQEVNIFTDDNNVLHFKKPNFEYSLKEKCSFLTGTPELKTIKELLPNILKQLGPKQFSAVKNLAEELKNQESKKQEEAPELVENFEEASKKEN